MEPCQNLKFCTVYSPYTCHNLSCMRPRLVSHVGDVPHSWWPMNSAIYEVLYYYTAHGGRSAGGSGTLSFAMPVSFGDLRTRKQQKNTRRQMPTKVAPATGATTFVKMSTPASVSNRATSLRVGILRVRIQADWEAYRARTSLD